MINSAARARKPSHCPFPSLAVVGVAVSLIIGGVGEGEIGDGSGLETGVMGEAVGATVVGEEGRGIVAGAVGRVVVVVGTSMTVGVTVAVGLGATVGMVAVGTVVGSGAV